MQKPKQEIWTETYTVHSYEVDTRGILSPIALCNYIQDAAGNHAHALGLSIHHLRTSQFTWVLSRMAIRIESYPEWGKTLTIHTWPSGIHKLFALRDFRIIAGGGKPAGACSTAWLVIDEQTRRPSRVEPFLDKLNYANIDRDMDHTLDKLPVLDRFDHEQSFRARYSDLDVNCHVNGISYIEWVIESIPADIQSSALLTELEINYLAEAYAGDLVISRCASFDGSDTSFLHSIVREKDNRELVRGKTAWKIVEQKI